MAETFKVGEIAILRGLEQWPEYEGQEVEIVGGLKERAGRLRNGKQITNACYRVLRRDGKTFQVPPRKLRKRRPPPDWVKLCNLTDLPREVTHA